MVKHSIPVDPDPQVLRKEDKIQKFFFRTPFRRAGSLLVELAQIIQIVYIIPIARWTHGFAARRDPHIVDSDVLETEQGLVQTAPVGLVVWDVPLEGLHHECVVGGVP